jgi:uncharacterized membrane protein HdeD (DUF308 family)
MIRVLAQNWWAIALRGGISMLFGLLALFLPGLTAASLIVLFGIFALADGAFAMMAAIWAAERHERWGPLVLEGAVGLVAGLIAVIEPLAAAFGLLMIIGVWAMVTGIFELMAARRLRRELAGEWLLASTGVLSILLGLFIAIFPGAALVALIWIVGIYALLFGVVLLAFAFRLREMAP